MNGQEFKNQFEPKELIQAKQLMEESKFTATLKLINELEKKKNLSPQN